jgi:serine/threonine-protein kinase
VKKYGPVPPGRAIHFLRQACHSLAEAHHNGLIHRDIKPANIYACHLGLEYDFVKVLDFGLVKTSQEASAESRQLTQEGVATGTPGYIAPEVALGKAAIDGRADLYSLGCVGYWLLTGQPVFAEDTHLATILAHVQSAPLPPSQRTELSIPAQLDEIILACLEKDPDDRPQDAHDLSNLLAECEGVRKWSPQMAEQWWDLHLPRDDAGGPDQVA